MLIARLNQIQEKYTFSYKLKEQIMYIKMYLPVPVVC